MENGVPVSASAFLTDWLRSYLSRPGVAFGCRCARTVEDRTRSLEDFHQGRSQAFKNLVFLAERM
jgi:hypothetical protein